MLSGRVITFGQSRLSEWKALLRDSNDQIQIDQLLGERAREQDTGRAREVLKEGRISDLRV